MSNELEIERLRTALEGSGAGAPIDDETIRRAVAGELTGNETRRLAVEALRSPESIASWRLARELAADDATDAGQARTAARTTPSWQRWGLAAAAAVVLAVVGLQTLNPPVTDDAPVFRADDRSPIASLVADESPLPRDAFDLAWSGPEGVRYEVTVTTLDLRVLHVANDLEATSLQVPERAFAEVASGAVIVWHIAGRTTDGDRLPARTFTQRLE